MTDIRIPASVFKSIIAAHPSDILVTRFVERQADCIRATVHAVMGKGDIDLADMHAMADKVADVWILSSLMFSLFPALKMEDRIGMKLEAMLKNVSVPEGTTH